jgi:sortase (surface protein transpeptidase)
VNSALPTKFVSFSTNHKKLIFLAVLLILLATIVIGFLANSKDSNVVAAPEIVTQSTDNPSEEPLDDYVWSGRPTEPKYIEIPSIGAGGFIQKVSIDQRKEVGVPSNINLAGWFIKGAIPGEKGLSIIDGHVDGISKPGIFKKLENVKVGTEFTVEFGNGSKKTFKTTGKSRVSIAVAPAVLFSQDPTVTSQLNLITCGGQYDKGNRRYLDRIIVTSVPVSA